MGYSMVVSDGRRYTEWVNMSYPEGRDRGAAWVPLWAERRAVEYYRDAGETRNAAVRADAATEKEMARLSAQLRAGWSAALL